MILVVIVLYLMALAFCVWLFWVSVKLMIHGFTRAFAPTFGPPATPQVVGPVPDATVPAPTRPDLAPWVLAAIKDHLRGCVTCRSAVESYRHEQGIPAIPLADLLASLQPQTVTRIVALVGAHDPAEVARTDVDLCPIHNLRMMPECPDCIWITAPTAQMIAEGYAVHWHEHDKDRPTDAQRAAYASRQSGDESPRPWWRFWEHWHVPSGAWQPVTEPEPLTAEEAEARDYLGWTDPEGTWIRLGACKGTD